MGTQETAFMVESCGDFSFETLFRVPETVGSPGSEPSRLRGLGQYLATNYLTNYDSQPNMQRRTKSQVKINHYSANCLVNR